MLVVVVAIVVCVEVSKEILCDRSSSVILVGRSSGLAVLSFSSTCVLMSLGKQVPSSPIIQNLICLSWSASSLANGLFDWSVTFLCHLLRWL